jgi:o-succinylbenzoate---CoA ligase
VTVLPDPVHAAPAEALAVLDRETAVSFGALDRRIAFAARALRRQGLGEGDRLAVYRGQDLRTLVLLFAAWRAGIVAVPVSPRQPAGAVPALLAEAGGAALVGEGGLDAEALTAGEADPGEVPPWRLDRPATVVFTSGSTGTPKAALHTLGNHVWSALGWAERAPLGPGDRWLLDLPVAHVGGLSLLFRTALAGAALALPEPGLPLAEALRRQGVTHVSLVATQLRRALDAGGDLRGLRLALLGGSAVPPDLLAEALRQRLPVAVSYGLTEMASTVTATAPGDPPEASAGTVLPYREVRLGPEGEILVRGRTRFVGYLTPEGLARPFDPEGWFATGDLGAWAEGGRLRVVGRRDNLFISGGENVQPEAVEAALLALPGLRQAVVVPVPDAEFGARPAAFVEADAWAPEAWRAALAERLPRFMLPVAFHPWPEDTRGLKPSRPLLAARAAASL